MAQQAINEQKNNKFRHIDVVIKPNVQISVYPSYVVIKQKDISGKSKTCSIPKSTWYTLVDFSDLIDKCFSIDEQFKSKDYKIQPSKFS